MDRAFAGGAGGIWSTGTEGSWKRVPLNEITLSRDSACQYVCTGGVRHDLFHRMGGDRQHQSGRNGSMLRTWATHFARGFVMSYRGSELTRGSETLIPLIELPSVLHQILWGRRLNAFRAISPDLVLAEWMGLLRFRTILARLI